MIRQTPGLLMLSHRQLFRQPREVMGAGLQLVRVLLYLLLQQFSLGDISSRPNPFEDIALQVQHRNGP